MTAPDDPSNERSAMESYLDSRSNKSRLHAKKNDSFSTWCYIIAVFSSFIAASGGSLEKIGLNVAWVPLMAGVPALALLTNSVFAFEEKFLWHRRRRLAYRTLWMRLVYEREEIGVVSAAMREFDESIAQEYPRFGNMGDKRGEGL